MDSWTEKSISETGQALNEAALHLESALEWSKKKADKASEATIDSAKQISKKIAQGSEWVSSEISRSIEALEKEIGKLSKDTKKHQP
jgi:predicted RNA-binding protein with PIN domain